MAVPGAVPAVVPGAGVRCLWWWPVRRPVCGSRRACCSCGSPEGLPPPRRWWRPGAAGGGARCGRRPVRGWSGGVVPSVRRRLPRGPCRCRCRCRWWRWWWWRWCPGWCGRYWWGCRPVLRWCGRGYARCRRAGGAVGRFAVARGRRWRRSVPGAPAGSGGGVPVVRRRLPRLRCPTAGSPAASRGVTASGVCHRLGGVSLSGPRPRGVSPVPPLGGAASGVCPWVPPLGAPLRVPRL